jgi:hypothetical protein
MLLDGRVTPEHFEQLQTLVSLRRVRMPRKTTSGNPAEHIKLAIASIDVQIKELTAQREQLAKVIPGVAAASAARRRGRPSSALASVSAKPKRVVSDATKRKLKAAAKARWARYRGEIE